MTKRSSNPIPEPLRPLPEPPLGFDYGSALAEADYAKTEARIMAYYDEAGSVSPEAWAKLGQSYAGDVSARVYDRLLRRYCTPKPLTRKQRRLAAQQARVRPRL